MCVCFAFVIHFSQNEKCSIYNYLAVGRNFFEQSNFTVTYIGCAFANWNFFKSCSFFFVFRFFFFAMLMSAFIVFVFGCFGFAVVFLFAKGIGNNKNIILPFVVYNGVGRHGINGGIF